MTPEREVQARRLLWAMAATDSGLQKEIVAALILLLCEGEPVPPVVGPMLVRGKHPVEP